MEHQHAVLLVEDETPIRDLLATLLREEGHEVIEAADGAAAIRVLAETTEPAQCICLIVLDMMLPRLSGLEVLGYLAKHGAYIPVVAMSASGSHLHQARVAGATAALPKPFDLEELMTTVDRVCGPRSSPAAAH